MSKPKPASPLRFLVLAATSLVLAGTFPAAAQTTIVSINLTEFATDVQQIDADEMFGIAAEGSVAGGWENLNQTATATNLRDSDGALTSVDFDLSAPNAWASFNGAYDDTPLKGGIDDYTGTVAPTLVTLSDLNATFPNGCKVIVYVGGFNANRGASISDGTTTYYYQAADSPVAPVAFTATTDTVDDGDDTAPEAQYAVFGSDFATLTDDTITITVDTLYGGGAAICGVQLVGEGVPPAPFADPVSINWKQFSGEINDPLEPYGVVPGSHWTNAQNGNSIANLVSNGGGPSTIDLTLTAEGAAGGLGTFDFSGTLDNTPMRAGLRVSTELGSRSINLSGLSGTYSTYDLIVYLAGFNQGDNTAVVTDGTTTYYCRIPNPFTASLVRSTDTGDDPIDDDGTYVRFEGLAGDTQTITVSRQGGEVAIGGLQITGTPVVPSSEIRILSVDRSVGTGEVTVVFASQAGVVYSAFGGTVLDDVVGWPEVSTSDIVDAGGTASFSFTPLGSPAAFFLQIRQD